LVEQRVLMADSTASDLEWLADDPIKRIDQDTLGRAPFARRVAAVLEDAAGLPSSTVVGLTGPWGSGKSSTVNLTLGLLASNRWQIQEVNPWGLRGPDAVVAEVLASIASALPGQGAAKARKALGKYTALASPLLSLLPAGGDVASTVANAAALRLAGDSTLAEQAKNVEKALLKLKQPVLIIVDDMDRLQPPELMALFKAVRMLGRLPYVHYLLAYDQRTVLDLIRATPIAHEDENRAAAFMEKIVTVRVDQPPTRPEQAEGFYDARMRTLLTKLNVVLSQRQQLRLDDEHRQLLGRVLREPRSIGRFFTQLYTYLPLIGLNEIDVPDFIALTLFRTSFSRLYEALSEDRQVLVGAWAQDWDNPLGEWGTLAQQLVKFDVPEPLQTLVAESLGLMFPLLSTGYTRSAADDVQRKRDRRLSDDDYVDRYFEMTIPADNVTDATITSALTEWMQGAPAANVLAFRRAVEPAEHSSSAYAASASVLRRADAKSTELSPDQAATVALAVTQMLSQIAEPTMTAAIGWLATLLHRATPRSNGVLLAAVDAPMTQRSSLWPLIRAVGRALMNTTTLPNDNRQWLEQLSRDSAEVAWHRYISQVALSDDAPREAAYGYLLQVQDVVGVEETNRRLVGALDDGRINVSDLAARFVSVGTYMEDYQEFIVEFNASELADRIGWDRIRGAQAALQKSRMELDYQESDKNNTSWANLRRVAGRALSDLLTSADSAVLSPLDQAPDRSVNAVRDRAPSLISAGQSADLLFTASVWVPFESAAQGDLTPDEFDEASRAWLTKLAAQPMTEWVAANAAGWQSTFQRWARTDSDGSRFQRAQAELRQDRHDPNAAANPDPRAVTVAALGAQVEFTQLRSSANRTEFARLLTVEAGFWLSNLDHDRTFSGSAPTTRPFPAAMTLAELWPLLRAVVSAVMSRQLRGGADDRSSKANLVVNFSGTTASGLDAVIDLTGLTRVANRQVARHAVTVETPAANAYSERGYAAAVDPDRLVAQLLRTWLRENGYRDYEHALAEASGMTT
jgi:hypothetical protein